ncbi:MAG: hypothetical protein P4L51_08670 [Puia sp.]|nr:hypothetical protein [Puia sp.]
MKKNLLWFTGIFLIASLVFLGSCHKNNSQTNSANPPAPADETVMAGLQGRVLDENGVPVQGAAVTSGTATTTTDVNGVFSFTNIQMSSRFGFVKVVKSGYFTGSRTILTHANAGNFVEINLLPRVSKGSFASASGGTITIQGSSTVAFTASSVVTASSGSSYTGNVNVYATYLDPTDSTLPLHMPGDLRGINTANQETGLQSFGMMGVELQDDAGNPLQIAAGQSATITMTIPASLLASAPATIPLWYFNDTTGKWIQQGTATKQGNTYVGQVGHFTFWNCDVPAGLVSFKVYLKDQNGNPVPYTYLQFVSSAYGTRGGYSDTSGFVQGMIPEGQIYTVQVLNKCAGVIYSQSTGMVLADLDLGTITVSQSSTALTLTGTVVDCSSNPVASGTVSALLEGLTYRAAVMNGSFTLSISRCSTEQASLQVIAVDNTTSQAGTATTVSVTTGSQDLGQLIACGTNTTQFITLVLGGSSSYSLNYPTDSIQYFAQGTTFNVWGTTRTGITPGKEISFNVQNVTGTGTYSIPIFDFVLSNEDYQNPSASPVQMTISSYGPVNGFISGTLSGTLVDTVSRVSYPMTGSFNFLRSN